MRVTTIRQYQQNDLDLEKVRAVAGNPDLTADEVFLFPKMVIARSGRNHNRTNITPEGQKAAVADWIGKPILYKDHEMKTDNQIGRIYESWTEDVDGETVTYARAFGCKAKDDKEADRQKKIKNRIHCELSCAYECLRSECSVCKADTTKGDCAIHAAMPEYCARDLEFKPNHVSFTGDPAVEGAGLVTNARQDDESLRLLAEDGRLFREWAGQEFSKWYRLNNRDAKQADIDSLTERLTAREMLTFARVEQAEYHKVIPSGAQQLVAPESSDVELPRSAEEIKQSFRKGNTI